MYWRAPASRVCESPALHMATGKERNVALPPALIAVALVTPLTRPARDYSSWWRRRARRIRCLPALHLSAGNKNAGVPVSSNHRH